jgi:twinkle protein
MNRDDYARLASVADAVRQSHGRAIPERWEPPKHAHLLKAPAAFLDDVLRKLSDDGTAGDPLPWRKCSGLFRLRPGELTIWPGSNGSAKSTMLSEVMVSLAHAGRRVVVLSLEMPAYAVAAKMAVQALANRHPFRTRVEAWAETLGDTLCFLDQVGDLEPAECIRLARYCAHELQTNHLLIDNLTKVVSADNEHTEQQRKFVAQLHRTAIDTGMHVHLVAHTRKPQDDERAPPGRYETAGSRTLVDQPDNVVCVWRNRPKERSIDAGELGKEVEPDLILNVDKQRHADYTGHIKLRFDRSCYRLVEEIGDHAAPMMC